MSWLCSVSELAYLDIADRPGAGARPLNRIAIALVALVELAALGALFAL